MLSNILEETSPQTREFYQDFIHDLYKRKFPSDIYKLIKSKYGVFQKRNYFETIEKFCLFIGCGRSGHSLIGSLIDAHPDMVMSDALKILRYIKQGFSAEQIYYLILEDSQSHAKKGRKVSGYSYAVPSQWQGRFRKIKVIGDKEAPPTTAILYLNPDLLDRLYETGNPVKFIHVIRNPYDTIKTLSKREFVDLKTATELYSMVCKAVAEIKKRIDQKDILDIQHELFIKSPQTYLSKICSFLEVDSPQDYLEDCASIVYKSPNQTRHEVNWTPDLIHRVEKMIDGFYFLSNYSYQE